MNKKNKRVDENPLYHDTWMLLKKYRDVVWSLELSVQQAQRKFQLEYGSSVEDFLDAMYAAGANLSGGKLEQYAKSIEQSNKMIKLMESAVGLLREKHKNGEAYYRVLYHTYLSPQQPRNVDEIVEDLCAYIPDISYATYYRRRKDAIDALSSVLWGYSAKDCVKILDSFFSK